jgi:hypothetical protein
MPAEQGARTLKRDLAQKGRRVLSARGVYSKRTGHQRADEYSQAVPGLPWQRFNLGGMTGGARRGYHKQIGSDRKVNTEHSNAALFQGGATGRRPVCYKKERSRRARIEWITLHVVTHTRTLYEYPVVVKGASSISDPVCEPSIKGCVWLSSLRFCEFRGSFPAF